MKWQAWLAGVLSPVLVAMVASSAPVSADMRVTRDMGGEVSSYVRKFEDLRESGERLVIDGPCLSACTLFTVILPRDQVCVTRRAVLGFHAATYYDSTRRSLVPTRKGTALVLNLYPPDIRNWIIRHGGLGPSIITQRGRELAALFNTCP